MSFEVFQFREKQTDSDSERWGVGPPVLGNFQCRATRMGPFAQWSNRWSNSGHNAYRKCSSGNRLCTENVANEEKMCRFFRFLVRKKSSIGLLCFPFKETSIAVAPVDVFRLVSHSASQSR